MFGYDLRLGRTRNYVFTNALRNAYFGRRIINCSRFNFARETVNYDTGVKYTIYVCTVSCMHLFNLVVLTYTTI